MGIVQHTTVEELANRKDLQTRMVGSPWRLVEAGAGGLCPHPGRWHREGEKHADLRPLAIEDPTQVPQVVWNQMPGLDREHDLFRRPGRSLVVEVQSPKRSTAMHASFGGRSAVSPALSG